MTIEVGDIKAGTGMLAVLFAFDGDAVLLSIHDGMLAADHAAQAAQRVGELLVRRHGRCLLAVALAGHPARQARHVGLRTWEGGEQRQDFLKSANLFRTENAGEWLTVACVKFLVSSMKSHPPAL